MFARQYKQALLEALKEIEDTIIEHWRSHKSPCWFSIYKEPYIRGKTTRDEEISVAITWIMQGAKGCNCFDDSLVLQDRVANLLLTMGAIDACCHIIEDASKDSVNFEPNILRATPRKLLINKGV